MSQKRQRKKREGKYKCSYSKRDECRLCFIRTGWRTHIKTETKPSRNAFFFQWPACFHLTFRFSLVQGRSTRRLATKRWQAATVTSCTNRMTRSADKQIKTWWDRLKVHPITSRVFFPLSKHFIRALHQIDLLHAINPEDLGNTLFDRPG